MERYKIIDILEQDYGCEELPAGKKLCVDVILEDISSKERLTVSAPDDELYEKHIDVNCIVTYNNNNLTLSKK